MASKFMSHHITEFNSMLSRIASVSYFKNETFWFWITCGSLFVGCVLYMRMILPFSRVAGLVCRNSLIFASTMNYSGILNLILRRVS